MSQVRFERYRVWALWSALNFFAAKKTWIDGPYRNSIQLRTTMSVGLRKHWGAG
jgi:hypothetical protein